jgi:hypothetical protein
VKKLEVLLPEYETQKKEYVALCNDLLTQYKQGKLTKPQWAEACDYLADCAKAIERNRKEMWARINGDKT